MPTGLTATATGQSQIGLAWTAPGDIGSSAINGYRMEFSPDGIGWADLVGNTASDATTEAPMQTAHDLDQQFGAGGCKSFKRHSRHGVHHGRQHRGI